MEANMQATNKKAAEATAKLTEDDTDYLMTKNGVQIFGSDLLGTKMTALLCEIINRFPHSHVASVWINSDGYPTDGEGAMVFGAAFADTRSIAINLERIWKEACDVSDVSRPALGFMGILWTNVLSAFSHELHHLTQAWADRDGYELSRMDPTSEKELEDECKDAAEMIMLDMAHLFDIEWPAVEALGWFGPKMMALFTGEQKDEEWVIGARTMLAEGIVYDNGEEQCLTFRDFVRRAYDESKDKDWTQPTTLANITAHLEDGSTQLLQAQPVVEPVINVAEATEVVAPVEAAAVVQQTVAFIDSGEGVVVEDNTPDDEPAEEDSDYVPASEMTLDAEYAVEPVPPTPAQVAQANTYATAAATAAATVPAAGHTETPYTPTNMTPEQQAGCIKAVWQTVYHHIFTKCGWQMNAATGRFHFAKPSAVLEGVDVSRLIAHFGAEGFIQSMDTHSSAGQYAAEAFNGVVRGKLTSKQGLPSYELTLNLGGHAFSRRFVPQNPETKKTDGSYTDSANECALNGTRKAFVYKGEAPRGCDFTTKCAVVINENDYQVVMAK